MSPLIDAQGRIFGRLNLVDAAIGAFLFALIPLAAAAVLLFRPPAPRIDSVEPAPVTMIEDRAALGSTLGGKVKVRGTGLRPILRAQVGDQPALAFIFENPTSADVLYGDLPAGLHDLVLFDGRQEVARAARAVTVAEKAASADTTVRLVGTLLAMPEATARGLTAGTKLPDERAPEMELVALGEAEPARYSVNGGSDVAVPDVWQRAAVVQVRCQASLVEPRECRTRGVVLAPNQVLPLPGSPALRLVIESVTPDQTPVRAAMRVRFIGYPTVIDLVRIGDRDRGHLALDGRGAEITALGGRRTTNGSMSVGLFQEGLNVTAGAEAVEQVTTVDATLQIGLDRSRSGWRYRNDVVRAGSPITFAAYDYVIRGIVLSLGIPTDTSR